MDIIREKLLADHFLELTVKARRRELHFLPFTFASNIMNNLVAERAFLRRKIQA